MLFVNIREDIKKEKVKKIMDLTVCNTYMSTNEENEMEKNKNQIWNLYDQAEITKINNTN